MPTVIASGTKTADGTEQDLATDTTNQEYELNVDLGNMAAADIVELRIYGKVLSGGAERLVFLAVYGPVVPFEKIVKQRFLANIHVRATLKQTAGTNRDYPWSLLALSGGGASAGEVADAVWDEAIAGHTSAGSFGAKNQRVVPSETIGDYKADVSALALESGGNLAAIKAKTDNLPAAPAAVGDIPTANQIADHVWDEVLSGHLTPGSCGAGLNAAGSAGDPWTTTLPGAYADGSAGKILGARLDAAVTTRAPESGGNLAAVKTKTDNLPASPAATGDIPSAATIASTVWNNATRTLTSFGTLVADIWANATRSLTDKTGFRISGTKQTLDALQDLSQAGAQAGATAALSAYDPPTKAELEAGLAALNDVTVGEVLSGDLGDGVSFPTNSLADLVRKLFWVVCNRLVITDASGAFTAYKTDGVTPAATGTITDNGSTTARSKPTWP
jgi:hypothetical protein